MTSRVTSGQRAASWSERSATSAVFVTLGIGVGAWAAALPAIKTKLDLSDQELSIALLALAVGSVLSTIAAGILAPRLGTGRATGIAGCGVIVTLLLPPLASSLAQFSILAFVVGLSTGALDVSMNGHASDIEHRWGGPIMSSFHGAFSIGGLGGAALGGLMAAQGWSAVGQVWAPIGIAAILTLLALPALGRGRTRQGGGLGLAWPTHSTFGLCVIVFLCLIVEGAMADWSAVYLTSVAGSTVAVAATGYAAFSLAMAGGRLVGDAVVEKLGAGLVVAAGGGLSFLGLGLAVMVPTPLAASIGFALVGLGLSNVVPVVFSAAARTGSSPSAGVATVATVGYVGFLSGPPLIGSIAALTGLRFGLGCLLLAAASTALIGMVALEPARRAD